MDDEELFARYKRRLANHAQTLNNEIRARDRAFVDRIQRIRSTCELDDSPASASIDSQHVIAPQMKKPAVSEHRFGQQQSPKRAPCTAI
jgi:hypothetical protein